MFFSYVCTYKWITIFYLPGMLQRRQQPCFASLMAKIRACSLEILREYINIYILLLQRRKVSSIDSLLGIYVFYNLIYELELYFFTYWFRIHLNYSNSSKKIKVAIATFIAGKLWDLGSKFSHESRKRGCWRPCNYIRSIFNKFWILILSLFFVSNSLK